MNPNQAPFVRVGIVIAAVLMLLYLPTREFLKITFMIGIPFIFILAFMRKQKRYSLPWIMALVLIVVTAGGYIYMLTGLPQQIAVRQIVIDGTALLTEGSYDDAADKFNELEQYGEENTMKEKLELVKIEKDADALLEEGKALIEAGEKDQALAVLESVPSGTRAYQEAAKLAASLKE